jgi:protein SCO1/2
MKKLLPVLVAACALTLSLAGCDKAGSTVASKPVPSFQSTDVTGLDYAKGFSLVDHTGKPRTLADFKGKVALVFFGYTQCPDVCPTTMAEMASVMQKLGPQADQVQVLFITLDPERDTQQLLAQYVPAFDKRFIGLRGTPEQTAKTAKEFKVFYTKVEGEDPKTYTIDHTAGTYVFDRDGKLRLFIKHDETDDAIVHDIRQLLS